MYISTKSDRVASSVQKKGASAVIKEYEKKLAHDPHNVEALSGLGDVYYNDQNWEKVFNIYKALYDLSSAHTEIVIADVTRRWGIAAFFLKKLDDAINTLMLSVKKAPDSYETNYYLGCAFMEKQVYDKAAYCLKKCRIITKTVKIFDMLGNQLMAKDFYGTRAEVNLAKLPHRGALIARVMQNGKVLATQSIKVR